MADDNSLRSRSNDGAHRSPSAGRRDINDPLAELARLIGQADPYGDQARAPAAAPRRDQGGGWRETAAALARQQAAAAPVAPAFDHHDTSVPPAFGGDDYGEEDFGDAPSSHGRAAYDDHQGHDNARHDEAQHGDPQRGEAAQHPDRGDESYFFDDTAPSDDATDAMYDDPPRARAQNGLLTAAVLIGCALFGTAGAYGYRTYYSGHQGSDAPVITADNTPVKVIPAANANAADAQSGKSIQDRIGNAGGERVVSHQEEPVQLGDLGNPRVVLPAPFTSLPGSAPATMSTTGTTALASAPPPTEPKKVHTLAIRPDGSEIGQQRTPPAAGQPIQLSPPAVNAALPPPPPVQTATAVARQSAVARADPPPSRNTGAPLTLVPSDGASQSPPRERVAVAPPQLASAPASGGGYAVQVSSQRNEADAQASYRSLQAKFPQQLAGREALVRRADLGPKGVYYRAMVGPFGSAGDADQFCSALKAAGGQCIVQRN